MRWQKDALTDTLASEQGNAESMPETRHADVQISATEDAKATDVGHVYTRMVLAALKTVFLKSKQGLVLIKE